MCVARHSDWFTDLFDIGSQNFNTCPLVQKHVKIILDEWILQTFPSNAIFYIFVRVYFFKNLQMMYFTAVKIIISGSRNCCNTLSKMQENTSQIIKNPTASEALRWDPDHRNPTNKKSLALRSYLKKSASVNMGGNLYDLGGNFTIPDIRFMISIRIITKRTRISWKLSLRHGNSSEFFSQICQLFSAHQLGN